MKLRTSFSKLTPFKKDLTRFAPVWALYLIGMLLVVFEDSGYYEYDRFAKNYLMEFIGATSVINLIYAGVCAVMLFSDLYNTRMCYSLHTMPQRREAWLLSHSAAALAFSLVPNVVIALAMMPTLKGYWFLSLYWLLGALLQFVFYFGVAALSAFLVGNRFAMLAVYAGLNFISMLIYAAVNTIYLPMLTGVKLVMEPFMLLCPVVYQMNNCQFFTFQQKEIIDANTHEITYFYQYTGLGEGWGYMAVIALVGVAAMALAMVLYRKRHLECAGDFIAFPKLNAVACVIITLCMGMLFAYVAEWVFGENYIVWMAVGVIIGYFGSLMLIQRRVKVFRPKAFAGLAAIAVVLTGSILLIAFDVFGITHWLPETENVKSVTIANHNSDNYSNGPGDYYYNNRISVKITEDEEITEIIEAHEDILQHLDYDEDHDRHYVVLTYELESGRLVRRYYNAPTDTKNYEIFSRYFYQPEQVLGYGDTPWEDFVAGVTYMWFDGGEIMPSMYTSVMEALKADCENGDVNMNGGSEICFYVEFGVQLSNGQEVWRSVYVENSAENTVAVLKSPENLLGYPELQTMLDSVGTVYLSSEPITGEEAQELLTALWQDCEDGNVTLSSDKEYLCELSYDIPAGSGYSSRYLTIFKGAENIAAWMAENGY